MTEKNKKQKYFSMTSYATTDCVINHRSYKFNLRSVNHKNLKLNIRHPFSFRMENKIRSKLKREIIRGAVDLIIEEDQETIDDENFQEWINECAEKKLPTPTWSDFFMKSNFLRKNYSLPADAEEQYYDQVEQSLDYLLSVFQERRENEGSELIEFISTYLDNIKSQIALIVKKLPDIHNNKMVQLKKRIQEISDSLNIAMKEDILKEVAVLIEKINVTEECDRLLVHLNSFHKALFKESKDGKFLDFLCQEINREINTLTTKSQSTDISELCIQMKSDLEKIREQVQNLV